MFVSTASRVVPGIGLTMARSLPTSLFNRLDLPAFGLPTIAIFTVSSSGFVAANVGDSRIYLARGGELEMLSRDHSIVAEQVALGMMTEEEAATSSMKHILTRNLGSSEIVEPEIFELEPSNNDCFVLCSDGLTDLVSDEEILKMTEMANDPEGLCRDFIRTVLDRGAHDNTTVVSVFLSDLKKPKRGILKKFF